MTTPAAMTIAVYQSVQKYWAYTNAVYGLDTDPSRTPLAVGSAVPVPVKGFESTAGSGFGGALYKNEVTGQYTLAYVGSELKDFVPDWLKADGTLAVQDLFNAARNFVSTWNPQFTDAMNFAYAAVKQIHTDLQKQGIENPSMTDIRARLDVTGHSLGGALAELVGKLFGLKGANIDGPGVSVLTQDPNFTRFIADKLLSDNSLPASLKAGMVEAVIRNPGDFVAAGFSFVSMAGEHLSEVGYAAEADAVRAYYAGTINILGGLGVSVLNPGAGVWMIGAGLVSLAKDGSNHPGSAIIRRTENALDVQPMDALNDVSTVDPWQVEGAAQWALFQKTPSATTYGVFVGWLAETRAGNIEKGLSPSGLAINGDVQQRGGQNVRAVLLDDGTIREIATPVDGGSPSYKDFKIMPDGRVGLVKPNGSIEFLIAQREDGGGVSLGAVVNLSSDNKLVITPLGQARMVSNGFDLSSAEADAIRAGRTTAQGVVWDRLQDIFDFAADPTGHPMAANQIEYNGHLYNAHGVNGYIRALGEGYNDVIEASGARYLLDALGNRTPVGPDQTIVLSDTGLPSVASAYRPDAAPVGAGTKLVLTQGTLVKQFEIDANGKVTRTTETQTFNDATAFEHKKEGGKNYIRAKDDEGNIGEWQEYKTVAEIARETFYENQLYSDMAGFLNALRGKDKVNQVLYGAKIAIDYQLKNGATEVKLGELDLGKTVAGLSATVGIVAGLHALQSKDTQTQLNGAVGLLGSLNNLSKVFDIKNAAGADGFLTGAQLGALNTVGALLSIANLKNLDNMLDNGQVGSAAATIYSAWQGASALHTAYTAATAAEAAEGAFGEHGRKRRSGRAVCGGRGDRRYCAGRPVCARRTATTARGLGRLQTQRTGPAGRQLA